MEIEHTNEDPWRLLSEWLAWWEADDRAPVKMPDALHVRTTVALIMAGREPAWMNRDDDDA